MPCVCELWAGASIVSFVRQFGLPLHGTSNKQATMEIYIGNIPFSMTNDELRSLFEEFGVVTSARVITDKRTGRSRGFGFVEMPHQAEAERAIAELNGKEVAGRRLRVSRASKERKR